MDVLKEWLPVLGALVAVASFWLQVRNRRDARRTTGIHISSGVQKGHALVFIRKIGDAPIFDVQITEYAGRAAHRVKLPLQFGEMTRETKPVRFGMTPNASQQAAVMVSYRTMFEGGRTVRYVWDAVAHRRLAANLTTRARLAQMPNYDLETAGEPLEQASPSS